MTEGRKWTAAIARVIALLVLLLGLPPRHHVVRGTTNDPYERMP
jgi:hypothetical protein